MRDILPILKSQQVMKQMRVLTSEVQVLAKHASALRSMPSLDARPVLQAADTLLKHLGASRSQFEEVRAVALALPRSLSARPVSRELSSAAEQWGTALRAEAKKFEIAVRSAEQEIKKLYATTNTRMNSPMRYPTAPSDTVDLLVGLAEFIGNFIGVMKRSKPSTPPASPAAKVTPAKVAPAQAPPPRMPSQGDAWKRLLGTGEPDALRALRGPVPTPEEVPNQYILSYIPVAVGVLEKTGDPRKLQTKTQGQKVHDTVLKLQGLRLLVIEKACKARHLSPPSSLNKWIQTLKASRTI